MTERLESTQGAEGDAVLSAHGTCPFCNGTCAHGRGPRERGTPVPPTPVPWAYEHSRIGVWLRDFLPGDDEQPSLSSVAREKQDRLRAESSAERGNGDTEKQKCVCTRVHTHADVLMCAYGRETET